MPIESDLLRDRLLGRAAQAVDAAQYRASVCQTIERNDKRIRRERLAVTAFWILCAVSATMWLWFSADAARLPRTPFLACIFFTWGGVEVVKHYVNSCRIDLLKEIKQLQLQVFELDREISKRPSGD